MGPLLATFYALLGRMFADEIKAWLPWVREQLVEMAVKGLPETARDRYSEEWRSHLNELPGEITKFVVALGFIKASFRSSASEFVGGTVTRVIGAVLLFVIFPVFMVVSAIIKLTSSGPVLDRKKLVGRGERPFHQFSFRTKKASSASKFLRRSKLTYLPLILNIIRGELAFIGPMPICPELAEHMGKAYPNFKLRFTVKPGINGWFQLAHTKHTPEEMVELDLYYVQNKSLRLDLEIARRAFLKALLGI
jgi:lipopolysaccharide/colanic/teichoic acid biosynthesis glycosyltransferase